MTIEALSGSLSGIQECSQQKVKDEQTGEERNVEALGRVPELKTEGPSEE